MTTKTFRHREKGKQWKLPEVVYIEGVPYFYVVDEYRRPKQGEIYLSGAIVEGYKANTDFSTEYLVIGFLRKAKQQTVWVTSLD